MCAFPDNALSNKRTKEGCTQNARNASQEGELDEDESVDVPKLELPM